MKAGPKAIPTGEPLSLAFLPPSGGARAVGFVEAFLRLPKGTAARTPIRLRPWQRAIVHGLFDDPRPRQGVVTLPRKNGKSLLAACLAVYGLLGDEEQGEGREVLVVASDERTAKVVWLLAPPHDRTGRPPGRGGPGVRRQDRPPRL